tara:strand:+ start:315 stop:509 length:195 start_codon:yes stop_codon:yes gene_type:complete
MKFLIADITKKPNHSIRKCNLPLNNKKVLVLNQGKVNNRKIQKFKLALKRFSFKQKNKIAEEQL